MDLFVSDLKNEFSEEIKFIFEENEILSIKKEIDDFLNSKEKVNFIYDLLLE